MGEKVQGRGLRGEEKGKVGNVDRRDAARLCGENSELLEPEEPLFASYVMLKCALPSNTGLMHGHEHEHSMDASVC